MEGRIPRESTSSHGVPLVVEIASTQYAWRGNDGCARMRSRKSAPGEQDGAPTMTDIELKQFVADLAVNLAETGRIIRESQAETNRVIRATDKQIDELRKELGGLGAKFGGFTEGMAYPSMKKILQERFGMSVIAPNVSARKNGRTMEVDVLAYSNADVNEVYVVEVKSHLREDGIQQILRILREFHNFYPGHDGKKVYGILAAVHVSEDLEKRVLKEGIYLARIHDETFEITVPDSFQPRAF
ncbi:MAG TPA: DUF3782 domain-containing protein [Thermoanaerobaculia bacterium]|jgi:hypothetical protein